MIPTEPTQYVLSFCLHIKRKHYQMHCVERNALRLIQMSLVYALNGSLFTSQHWLSLETNQLQPSFAKLHCVIRPQLVKERTEIMSDCIAKEMSTFLRILIPKPHASNTEYSQESLSIETCQASDSLSHSESCWFSATFRHCFGWIPYQISFYICDFCA